MFFCGIIKIMQKTKVTNRKIFSLFWRYLEGYRGLFFSVVILNILWSVTEVLIPYTFKRIIDIIAIEIPQGVISTELRQIIIIMSVLFVAGFVLDRLVWLLDGKYLLHSIKKMQVDMLRRTLHHSFSFFENEFTGAIVSNFNKFERAYRTVWEVIQQSFLTTLGMIIFVLLILWHNNTILAVAVFIWTIVYLLVNYVTSKYKLKHDVVRSKAESTVTGAIADIISNYTNVKLFSAYNAETSYFQQKTEDLYLKRRKSWNLAVLFDGIQGVFMSGFNIVLIAGVVYLWAQGRATVGDIILIQSYAWLIFSRVWNFGRQVRDVFEAFADAREYAEIYYTPPLILDKSDAVDLQVKKGTIKFECVSFAYHEKKRLLSDFSLSVKQGEKVALVGHSGAGKSTIIKLLLRQYDSTKGEIKIDGTSIRLATQESVWKSIGFVPQDPSLFHRSIYENIAYGNPNATKKEIIMAAQRAQCHEFINSLPQGYDTHVGERGIKLSGGERQRIAIARAIIKNAPILVLDEATSNLDSESELLIQEAFHELMKGKTVIAIAHRLSTIMHMDRIVVIEKGHIREEGSHRTLLRKKNGAYKNLWNTQTSGFIV